MLQYAKKFIGKKKTLAWALGLAAPAAIAVIAMMIQSAWPSPTLVAEKTIFRLDETPVFEILLPIDNKSSAATLLVREARAQGGQGASLRIDKYSLRARLKNAAEKPAELDPSMQVIGNNIVQLTYAKTDAGVRPGKYRAEVIVRRGVKKFVLEKEFYWGVLAINADKSVYEAGETAYLQMAVLDEYGHTVCDADLELHIRAPGARAKTFSTEDGTVVRSDTCERDNVTDHPDYFAYYAVPRAGDYELTLTNLSNGYAITDGFSSSSGFSSGRSAGVSGSAEKNSVPFEIRRISATRINPFKAAYTMRFTVVAREDFTGEIAETVPERFEILRADPDSDFLLQHQDDGQTLVWRAVLRAGERREYSYTYQAPLVSPWLWFAGPLEIRTDNGDEESAAASGIVFREARRWQLASDATCNSQGGGGNWDDSTKWSCGVVPAAGDDAVIKSGHNIVVNVNTNVLKSLTIDNGATLSTDGNSRVISITQSTGSGVNFTNNGTFTAGNSKVTIKHPGSNVTTSAFSGTFTGGSALNNLEILSDTLGGNRTINMNAAFTAGGTWLIQPDVTSGGSSRKLTVNLGGTTAVTGAVTITADSSCAGGTANAVAEVDTVSGTNHALSAGSVDIVGACSLLIRASTFTLTGTSGTILTVGSSATFTAASGSTTKFTGNGSVTLTNNVTITFDNLELSPALAGGAKTYTFGTSALTVNGNFDVKPTATAASQSLAVNMAAAITVGATKTTTVQPDTTNSPTANLSTNTSNALSTGFLNIQDNGTFTAGSATLTLTGTTGTLLTRSTSGAFSGGTGTVTLTGSGSNTVNSGTFTGSNKFNNFIVNITGVTKTLGAAIEAGDTVTITLGTLNTSAASNHALTAGKISIANSASAVLVVNASIVTLNATSGTLFTRGASGVFTQGTSEVKITSSSGSPTFLSGAATFHKLTVDSAATIINIGGAVTINNAANADFTITSGVFNVGGADFTGPGSGNGTFAIASGAAFCLGGTTGATNATCDSGATQTVVRNMPTFQTYSFNAASTVRYLSDAAQTVSQTPAYGNLRLVPALNAARIYSLGGAMTIDGDFTINPSADSIFALTVNLGGNIAVAASKTTTITRTNAATSVLDTRPSTTDYNLTTGHLTIQTGGTLDAASSASAINVAGDYTNNGTFTAGNSTATFNGSSKQTLSGTMTGSSAFYNFTVTNTSGASASDCERAGFTPSVDLDAAATATNDYTITAANVRIEYNSGSTYTFANINWNGQAAGTRIYFRNSAETGTWLLNVSGTQTAVSFVNVSRSNASGGNEINASDGTNINCDNNTNWNFGGAPAPPSVETHDMRLRGLLRFRGTVRLR